MPSNKNKVELGVFNANGENLFLLPLEAFNWQQGCRAQWLDDDLFMYNDFDINAQSFISRVYSLTRGVIPPF